jgi:hypothetical protein
MSWLNDVSTDGNSDAKLERFYHVISMNVLGFVSLGFVAIALELTHNIYFQVAMLSFAAAGIWAAKPPLLAWLSSTLPGNMAASIATITCAGNVSGIVAPIVMYTLPYISPLVMQSLPYREKYDNDEMITGVVPRVRQVIMYQVASF